MAAAATAWVTGVVQGQVTDRRSRRLGDSRSSGVDVAYPPAARRRDGLGAGWDTRNPRKESVTTQHLDLPDPLFAGMAPQAMPFAESIAD
ncbi:MAG: hypothetical protein DRI40_04015 [Chloroflexi bacterium]|nr:MAG: hypothetical protein DRI40_04015 [Chloroflexota bacterium]